MRKYRYPYDVSVETTEYEQWLAFKAEFEAEVARELPDKVIEPCGEIIKLTDGQNPEFYRKARELVAACCNQSPGPDPARRLYRYHGPGGTGAIITTRDCARY